MPRSSKSRNTPVLNQEGLERLALRYVERYATTRAKLTRYLERKLYEQGWSTAEAPPIAALVDRFAAAGYVDDRQFAGNRAAALTRRGYGAGRVRLSLRAAGIAAEDAADALAESARQDHAAALAFARRRRIGPFANVPLDAVAHRRAFAAMIRAGHAPDIVRKLLASSPENDFGCDEPGAGPID